MGRISPETAAEIAKTYKVKVYTIGVGGEGESPFLVETLFGKRYVYQKVDLDEETLKHIADVTGGSYFRAQDTASLQEIYEQIDQMEAEAEAGAEVAEQYTGDILKHRFSELEATAGADLEPQPGLAGGVGGRRARDHLWSRTRPGPGRLRSAAG